MPPLAWPGPITGGPVRFVNSHWVVDPAVLERELGLETALLLNDFGAMAYAADALGPGDPSRMSAGPMCRCQRRARFR